MSCIDRLPGYRLRQSLRRAWSRVPGTSQRIWVEPYTMLSRQRLIALERSVQSMVRGRVVGDIVECGTAAGGSAALMALWLKRLGSDKTVYVFDTFEGLPPPTSDDPDYEKACQYTGRCRGELDEVKDLFQQLGVLDRAVFIKGDFRDTLPGCGINRIALLHLDGDWYASTKVCLTYFYDRVEPGGVVHVDDYGAWQGCRKAVDEFFAVRGVVPAMRAVDYTGRVITKGVSNG